MATGEEATKRTPPHTHTHRYTHTGIHIHTYSSLTRRHTRTHLRPAMQLLKELGQRCRLAFAVQMGL